MEGSVAAGGQAAGGQAAGQGEGEGAAGQQGPDVAALAEQLSTLSAGQEELRQFLQQQAQQQQQEPQQPGQEESGELDLSFLDPEEPGFDPATVADRLGGLIEQAAQQHVAPLQSEVAEMRRTSEAERLIGEFPELGEPEVAEQVVGLARQIAQAHGRPELANEPWFWRMTYMGTRAADAANEEGDAPPAAHLEGAGGAGPGGGQQVDLGDLIVGAPRGGRSVLPF